MQAVGSARILTRKRQREFRRWWHRWGLLVQAGGVVLLILCLVLAIAAGGAGPKEEGTRPDVWEAGTVTTVEPMTTQAPTTDPSPTLAPENYQWPFNTLSADWGGDDVAGFTFYEIPAEYARTGGLLPEVVQVYTYCLCRDYGVDYYTVLGMIEVESSYKWDASSGRAWGYMQIAPGWHEERMARLGFTDILNPYQNIGTGIDYLAELLARYDGDYNKALTAYCWGPSGAYDNFFSKGLAGSNYSQNVLEAAQTIKERLGGDGL